MLQHGRQVAVGASEAAGQVALHRTVPGYDAGRETMRYAFDDYTLDPEHYELRQAGRLVRLEPRVFDLLVYLVQHRGRTVTKEEFLEQLWPNQFVSDDSLTTAVA